MTWFFKLAEDSIHNFHDMYVEFLRHYIMFTRHGALASNQWKMSQTPNESLKDFIEKFKQVVSKVLVSDETAVDTLRKMLSVHFESHDDL